MQPELQPIALTEPHAGAAGDGRGVDRRRSIQSSAAVFRSHPELALIALLLILTSIFSRSFSKGLSIGPLYVTEMVMLASGAIAIGRLGIVASWGALRRLPLVPLLLIWAVGGIAILRGLDNYGFSMVTHDVGLVDYSLLLPLLALVVVDRPRYEAIFATLVVCGFAGIATFFVAYTASQVTNKSDALITLQGSAAGLYMSLATVWIVARLVNGVRTPKWMVALVPVSLVLMGLTTQRSVWMIAIVSLGAVVVLAPRNVRLHSAFAVAGVLVVAFVAAIGIQAGINATSGGVVGSGENFATGSVENSKSGSSGREEPQLAQELAGLGGGTSDEADNVRWRLAYWAELIRRTPRHPLLGVGFGAPAEFTWEGRKYDFRDGDPGTGIDVAGPHNSFVNFLYRLGIPAFFALLLVGFFALRIVARTLWQRSASVDDRVMLTTLVAMLAAGAMASSFNEGLTGPFLGIFFWVPLGMLLLWPGTRGDAPIIPTSS